MIDRTTRLRWRRRFRRSRHQVEDIGVQAEQHLDRHLFRRIARLGSVRRFVASWVLLIILLISLVLLQNRALGSYYLRSQPAPGGIYTEGIVGTFTNASPLYATGSVDSSVARLVFAGLFKYDQSNQLIGDLASHYEVDDRGVRYTIHLRDSLKWQDGRSLTADDIVFTYKTIQNPDTKSPLLNSWAGITVHSTDAKTVVFTLPNSLSAFPYSLTNGIVPKHLLDGIPPSQLRAISFNTESPVGAGPFKWQGVDVSGTTPEDRQQNIALVPFDDYHDHKPKLSKFVINAFTNENLMLEKFNDQQLSAMAGLNSTPDNLVNDPDINEFNVPLTGVVMIFLKNSHPLLQDPKVRQALITASDTSKIVQGLDHIVITAQQPLLRGQVGYNESLNQQGFNKDIANKLLDEAGWTKGSDGLRSKNGLPLQFKLYSQNNSEYAYVTQQLQQQWREVGVDAEVFLQPESDLQTTITFHNYDALLYGISIGVDPDVFAYWHSTQADPRSFNRLNFSEYKSVEADKALEAGRTRADTNLRGLKYVPFLEAWKRDVPAIALYQPRFLYLTRVPVANFEPKLFNNSADRFNNIQNWMIREEQVVR